MTTGGNVLRFYRHVRGEAPTHLHCGGRREMHESARNEGRPYHLLRFELSDVDPAFGGPAAEADRNHSPSRSARTTVTSASMPSSCGGHGARVQRAPASEPEPCYVLIEPEVRTIWLAAEQPCGKRLAPALHLWLRHSERHHDKRCGAMYVHRAGRLPPKPPVERLSIFPVQKTVGTFHIIDLGQGAVL